MYKGDIDKKVAYFVLPDQKEETMDIMEWYGGSLHSKEEMQSKDWVGFDIEIRPIGREANFDYQISFK